MSRIGARSCTLCGKWGAAKEGWPRNPPLPRVFLLLHVTTAPEDFEHKHHTFNAPTLGDIGSRVGDAQFWGVFGNPVLGKNPPRNPPSWRGRGFLGGFLGKNPPLPRPLPGREPPFLDPSYDLPVPRQ